MSYDQLTSCPDIEPAFHEVLEACRPFTMTSLERMYALYQATQHVVRAGIEGDLVECGVWKGGSAMVIAMTLLQLGETDRVIQCFDTFEGMTEPGARDLDYDGLHASERLDDQKWRTFSDVARAAIDEVRTNVAGTGYPADKLAFVKGPVEQTLPEHAPSRIALLRLDTDWYESTYHELTHLYPRLERGGVLLVDDYGHWKGCREAIDTYLREHGIHMLLQRCDYTGRMGIKP